MDIDSNLYFSSIIYSLSSALDSLDEGALPQLTRTSINNTTTNNKTFSRDLEGPSSNPLVIGENSFSIDARALPAEPQGKRQRTEQARDLPSLDMFRPTITPSNENKTQDLIYRARDLLIEAYSASTSRTQQTNILELVQVFREYIESRVLRKTSTILATQVASLERATRKVETLARLKPISRPETTQTSQSTQPTQSTLNT
jgi:hypothetical protein